MSHDRQSRQQLFDLALLLALTLAVRLIYLDHTPFIDELNHVLAAQSLLTDGTLQIGDASTYTRAWAFTYLVAGMFSVFGESLVVGRLPAVAAGTGLVLVVFLWTRSVSNRTAAWAAALLLSLYPESIYLSQQVRFYTLHSLLFWSACFAVYRLLDDSPLTRSQAIGLAVGALVALVSAFHLQILTVIGVGGLLLWAALRIGIAAPTIIKSRPYFRWVLPAAVVLMFIVGFAAMESGLVERLLNRFQHADLWAARARSNPLFYHWMFILDYPTLWPLFPLAILIAGAGRSRPVAMCTVIFGVAFIVHSFAAWKAPRYIFYAMPAFFMIWGIAIAEIVPWLRRRLVGLLSILFSGRVSAKAVRAAAVLLLVGTVLFAALSNSAFSYTRKLVTVPDEEWNEETGYRGHPDWQQAAEHLQPVLQEVEAVVTPADLEALYYIERLDVVLNADYLFDGEQMLPEFTIDSKTQRPLISTPESVRAMINCIRSGVLIIPERKWRNDYTVPPATADVIVQHTRPISIPESTRLLAFRWQTSGEELRTDCPTELVEPRVASAGTFHSSANSHRKRSSER